MSNYIEDMAADEYEYAGLQDYIRESEEALPAKCRALVAEQSPGASEEHFEELVNRLIARVRKTGEYPALAWQNM